MPSYKFTYSLAPNGSGKTVLTGKVEQSGVSKDFVMIVPLYVDLGKGWVYLGKVTVVGNSAVELRNVILPEAPKKVAIAALQDVLAAKIENIQQ
jgi:hypothetical protein